MNSSIRALVFFFMAIAGAIFAYSIFHAGISSVKGHGNLHEFFANAVVVIGGILSTNLGAVLGVTLAPPGGGNKGNAANHKTSFLFLKSSVNPQNGDSPPPEAQPPQKLQIIACWVYAIGLLAATIFWVITIINKVPDDQVVNLLPQLSKTLIGVIVGMLTVGLGRR